MCIAESQSPVAVPMRMLEVFTSPETYEQNMDVVQKIWNFLIDKGLLKL